MRLLTIKEIRKKFKDDPTFYEECDSTNHGEESFFGLSKEMYSRIARVFGRGQLKIENNRITRGKYLGYYIPDEFIVKEE